MAKRTYGGSLPAQTSVQAQYKEDEKVESDIISKMSPKLGGNPVKPLIIVAIVLGVLFIALTIAYIYVIKFDKGNGSATADGAATAFITNLTDDDNLYSYIPRQIRNNGALVDDGYMSMLQQLDEAHNVSVSNLSILQSQDASPDRLQTYENTINNLYKVDLDIKLAKSISVRVVYDTSDDTLSSDERAFDIDVVAVKNGFRWYVVPGLTEYNELVRTDKIIADASEEVEPEEDIDETVSEDSAKEDETEVSSLAKTEEPVVIDIREEIVKEVKELDFKKDALEEARQGKVIIDDVECVIPGKIEDFSEVFTVDYGHNGLEKDTVIAPNYLVEKIPVHFVNPDYNHTDLMISLGNDTDEAIAAENSIVTCVGIVWPHSTYEYQVYDYPLVYLPGNVTFGTSLEDVEEMYGELADAEDVSHVHVYSDKTRVYQIELNNCHNFLYLQFEDNKLVGMEWYYYDFNEY